MAKKIKIGDGVEEEVLEMSDISALREAIVGLQADNSEFRAKFEGLTVKPTVQPTKKTFSEKLAEWWGE